MARSEIAFRHASHGLHMHNFQQNYRFGYELCGLRTQAGIPTPLQLKYQPRINPTLSEVVLVISQCFELQIIFTNWHLMRGIEDL